MALRLSTHHNIPRDVATHMAKLSLHSPAELKAMAKANAAGDKRIAAAFEKDADNYVVHAKQMAALAAAHNGKSSGKSSGKGKGGNPNHDPKTGEFTSK